MIVLILPFHLCLDLLRGFSLEFNRIKDLELIFPCVLRTLPIVTFIDLIILTMLCGWEIYELRYVIFCFLLSLPLSYNQTFKPLVSKATNLCLSPRTGLNNTRPSAHMQLAREFPVALE
jgi:hypothetical protein